MNASPTENIVFLIGELKGVARQSETKNGTKMIRRVISVARHWTDSNGKFHEDFDDFEIISWGQVADSVEEIENGALVRVKGRIKVEKWYDGAETKSAIRIAAENVTLLCY